MTDRDNPVTTYLTDAEKRQVEAWANETGKSVSGLLRDAILEYTDRDRAARITDEVVDLRDEIEALRGELREQMDHTHTSAHAAQRGSETVEKAREIVQRIRENHGHQCTTEDLERAIEDIAGGDPRTIEKYREHLRARGHLLEHPVSDAEVWFTDVEDWIDMCLRVTEPGRRLSDDFLDPYPQDICSEYISRAEQRDEEAVVDE